MFVGVGVGVGRQRVSGGGVVFDADYQAVLNYATSLGYTLPSSGQQVKQNQLVLDLKSGGIWSKLDSLRVYATDGSSNFALIDWKRLVLCTAVNSPTFTANQGFNSNGTSSYINTNYNPTLNAVNASVNNMSVGFWENAVVNSGSSVFTGGDNLDFDILVVQRFSSSNGFIRINDGGSIARPLLANYSLGLALGQRINSTTIEYYAPNSNFFNYTSNPSNGLCNASIWDLRFTSIYSNSAPISLGFLGASFTSTQVSNFRTAVTNYMTSL